MMQRIKSALWLEQRVGASFSEGGERAVRATLEVGLALSRRRLWSSSCRGRRGSEAPLTDREWVTLPLWCGPTCCVGPGQGFGRCP